VKDSTSHSPKELVEPVLPIELEDELVQYC
jgi:hypothetical protein